MIERKLLLDEQFDTPALDSQLAWFNPPRTWAIDPTRSMLVIEPEAKTDYWQKTHYGFEADNGHFLFAAVEGDFVLTTAIRFYPVHQYDQAGLMVRLSPHCWLKTSVEYEAEGPDRLGVVVTNGGYSDWSTQNFDPGRRDITLRVRREGSDYLVEYAASLETPDVAWIQMRMAHLHEDQASGQVQAGLYACSPTEAGYRAEFDFLKLEQGRV
jgi:regulation of enolase protein 1 (concanavalin A-like superfamily)